MPKANGSCIICGEGPTVKAHLFPRALMLDMKGTSTQLVAGNLHAEGIGLSQNGDWDSTLLCKRHEDVIGAGDEYGVGFCRGWRSKAKPYTEGQAVMVENPDPAKLMHFAYANVWRHVNCRAGRASKMNLGPYSDQIQRQMETGGPYDLQLLVGRSGFTVNERRVDVAIAPHRTKMGRCLALAIFNCGFRFLFENRSTAISGKLEAILGKR